jgi:predicted nucleotidyltransferase
LIKLLSLEREFLLEWSVYGRLSIRLSANDVEHRTIKPAGNRIGVQQPMANKEIDGFIRQIVTKFDPERIILFGSHAYGTPSSSSDVDIVVVMNTPLKAIEQEVLIRKEIPRRFPLDLIVMKPRQFARRLKLGDTLIRTVTARGKILYEKDNRRMG